MSSAVIGWPLTNATTCCAPAIRDVANVATATRMAAAKAFQRMRDAISDLTWSRSFDGQCAVPLLPWPLASSNITPMWKNLVRGSDRSQVVRSQRAQAELQ